MGPRCMRKVLDGNKGTEKFRCMCYGCDVTPERAAINLALCRCIFIAAWVAMVLWFS